MIVERPHLKKSDLSDSTCIVEVVDRPNQDQVNLKMFYGKPGSRTTEICFPFDLSKDTATDVVSEMIKENLIYDYDEPMARRKLEEAIRMILLGQIRSSSVELKSTTRSTPVVSPLLSPQSSSNAFIPPLSGIPPSNVVVPSLSSHQMTPRSLSPVRGSSPTRQHIPTDPLLYSDSHSYKSSSSIDAVSCSSSTPSNSSLTKSSQDSAVQARLRELQEINLKGLGSMGVNPSKHPSQKSQSMTNMNDIWPMTFGGNDKTSPTRRETVPIVSVNQSRVTHTLQAPIIPRPVSQRPPDSFTNNSVSSGVPPPPPSRHTRQRSSSSSSSVITGVSFELEEFKLEKDF